ncbi:MAG: ClpXP protease specificity-enhancing factor SspB [Ghiorsea sp.]|nr:ClpXP protease specificity-enhancing factor SspB [Ghiorsea sp.]
MSVSFEDALKAKKLRDFFYEHKRIFILVDAAADDVQLPEHLKHDHALPLVLNARMPQPIHIQDSQLESNFSFSGVSQHCVIPMKRIWAAYLPEQDLSSGMVWEDAMPDALKAVIPQESLEQAPVIAIAAEDAAQPNEAETGRKVRHLRIVK